jgi:hypothetical protein
MVIADAGTWLRIGAVSINKRKIKLIRSQGNNVLIDVSGREKEFHAGNVIAIDYRDVTDPQVFGSAGELEAWVLEATLLNQFDWTGKFPSDLEITVNTPEDVTLNWVNNGTADYDNIILERSTDNVSYAAVSVLPIGTTIAADDITIDTYFWRIRYKAGTSYSYASNVVTVTESIILNAIGARLTEDGKVRLTEDGKIRVVETV